MNKKSSLPHLFFFSILSARSALHEACLWGGSHEVIETLLKYGAKTDRLAKLRDLFFNNEKLFEPKHATTDFQYFYL